MADFELNAWVTATRDMGYDDADNPVKIGQVFQLGGHVNDEVMVKIGYLTLLKPQPKKRPKKFRKFMDSLHVCAGKHGCGRKFKYEDHRDRCGYKHLQDQAALLAEQEQAARERTFNRLERDPLNLSGPDVPQRGKVIYPNHPQGERLVHVGA